MKRYFYIFDDKRLGPVSHEEIKDANISEETLVWYDGLDDWKLAKDLEDFNFLVNDVLVPIETKDDQLINERDLELGPEDVIQADQVISGQIDTPYQESSNSLKVYGIQEETFDFDQRIYPKQTMFAAPFSFKGRIRRTEYWLSWVIAYLYLIIIIGVTASTGKSTHGNPLYFIFMIPFYWFAIAQNTKRCHDRGHSGWFQIIPFYGLWLVFGSSERFVNAYGPNPKGNN